jgi:hypothetical protein
MEIDITEFARTAETHDLSASVAELGKDAGKITWNNALQEAATTQLIDAEHRDEFESWARAFGAWDGDEIAAWSLDECNALLLQYIAGDLNELESLCYSSDEPFEINWRKAEKLSERGTISGSIYKGDDGRLYFYMGS